MTQSDAAKNTFFSLTLYNFQKSGRAVAYQSLPLRGPWANNFSRLEESKTQLHVLYREPLDQSEHLSDSIQLL